MNKKILLLSLLFFFSCNDGDLQIETIDFNGVSIDFCELITDTSSTFFFKLNPTEALILQLQNGILKNEASNGAITSEVPGQSQVTYRIFDGDVSANYFCDELRPATPLVVEEIPAGGGSVLVTTVQSETDTLAFEHTIELKDISFVNSKGERITNLLIDNFGTITTFNIEIE